MIWAEKIQELNTRNLLGLSLLVLNLVMLPWLMFSDNKPEYEYADAPLVELLNSQQPVLESAAEFKQDGFRKTHDSHAVNLEPGDAHHQKKIDAHEVEPHALQKQSSRNLSPVDHNHSGHQNPAHREAEHKNIDKQASVHKTQTHDIVHEKKANIGTGITLHSHLCYELGPLKTNDEQIKLQNLIEAKGMFTSIKYTKSQENLGYWVFIPPLRSRALGRLKVEELKLQGFKDVALLTRNKPKNAVSIGVFDDQKNANKQLLRAQSMGFNAKMDIRYESLGEMWLSIEVSQQKNLDEHGWRELTKDYPHVKKHPINCR